MTTGTTADRIAVLSQVIPLDPINGSVVDCAIAKVDAEVATSNTLPVIGVIRPNPTDPHPRDGRPEVRSHLEKNARKRSPPSTFSVKIGYDELGEVLLTNQVFVTSTDGAFSAAGDSGSLIVNDDGAPVALLVGGSDTMTVATPFSSVLSALGNFSVAT